MKKIPTIYARDPETNLRHVRNEPHPDCGWVFNGEGTATYKWDGTAVLIEHGGMWRRREVKPGRTEPDGFRQEGDADPVTGKRVGWVPVVFTDPADQWHAEAWDTLVGSFAGHVEDLTDGTYELVGPKIQGNPHQLDDHVLLPHGCVAFSNVPTEFDALGAWLHDVAATGQAPLDDPALFPEYVPIGFEGIVWHHPDGRMAKIKAKDFPT